MDKPKTRGRPRIDAIIPLETIVEVFLKSRSLLEAARQLGISPRTLERELKLARVDTHKPRCRSYPRDSTEKPWNTDFTGPVHAWFKEHPDNTIHSPTQLASIIGCTEKRVRDYFYKKRLALEMFLQTLGNLREVPNKIVNVRGEGFYCKFITDYKLRVDPVSFVITIQGFTSAAGTFTAKIGFVDYCKMFDRRIDPRSFFRGVAK